jgi:competence protein ComEC
VAADRRLLPVAAAVWVAAWAALQLRNGLPAATCWVALIGGVGLLVAKWWRSPPSDARLPGAGSRAAVVAAVLVAAGASGLAADARLAAIHAGPLESLAAARAVVETDLTVRSYPVARLEKPRGSARATTVVTLTAEATRVSARGRVTTTHNPIAVESADRSWLKVLPGQQVRTGGRLAPANWRPATTALLLARAPRPADDAPWRSRAASAVRADLRAALTGLPPDRRGLLPGLEFGDTSGLDPELAERFRAAGLSRLLAIDGAKLAILLGGVLALARWVGARGRVLPALGLACLCGLAEVVGPKPSLLRAGAMAAVVLVAPLLGRRGGAATGLSAATVLLVLTDPWLARSYGFALSVAGTAGLLCLTPWFRERLEGRVPARVVGPLAVAAAAQTACLPVLVLMTGGVSLVAVPANLLAAPAVPPALFLGFTAGAIQPLSPTVAGWVGYGAGLAAAWIIGVARHAGALPGATLPWPHGAPGALLAVALLGVAVLLVRRRAARPVNRSVRRRVLVGLAWLLAAILVVRPRLIPLPGVFDSVRWPPPGWQLVACDVGQGDALALNAGPGAAVVVDTGPDPRLVDRCLQTLGIHVVPYLLLTHFHADHVEGLPAVLHGRSVAEIGVSPLADPPAEVARVQRWAAAARVPITSPKVGEARSVGGLSWRVLWPRGDLLHQGSAPNNASVVLLVTTASGLRLLLSGDIEAPAQQALHQAEPDLRVDVLKTPHHGSANQDPEFLRSLGAKVALTSVGVGNVYGHPAPETMALLRGAGMASGRTDLDGDLAATVVAGRLSLVARSRAPDRPGGPADPPVAGASGDQSDLPRGHRHQRGRSLVGPAYQS